MPPSLRKACHACSTAKRRCHPQLPQCPRCLEKGLACTYDLEPVAHSSEEGTRSDVAAQEEPHSFNSPRVFNSIESAHQHAISGFRLHASNAHEVPLMANPETFTLVLDHLLQIPVLTFRGQTSAFAHAQILSTLGWTKEPSLRQSGNTPLQPTTFSPVQMEATIRDLLALDIHALTFTEFLSKIHILIAVIFTSVFQVQSSGNTDFSELESLIGLISFWERHFKAILPKNLSIDLSPWQAWVIAESCRRTLLALQWISGVVELYQSGYCSYRPFVESLPFDARTGLWEAETEEDWSAALERHEDSGESSLVSWCEFIENGGPSPRPQFDGMLQRLFLAAYYGKETQLPQNQQHSVHPKFRMPDNKAPA